MENLEKMTKEELILKLNNTITNYETKIEELTSNYENKIEGLNASLRKVNEELEKLIAEYEKKKQEYDVLKHNIFSKQTEKTKLIKKEEETINEVESNLEKNEKETAVEEQVKELLKKPKKERKTPTSSFLNNLIKMNNIVKEEIKDYPFEEKNVDRTKVKKIGEDVSYKINVKVSFELLKIIRPKYKDKEHIYQALSDDVFPHSILTPSLASFLINGKYRLHLPLYRLKDVLNNLGIQVSEADLSNYIKRSCDLLEPIYTRLKEELINTKVDHIDETTIKVLNEKKEKCYMFVYQNGNWATNKVCIYEFNESRKTDKVLELLKDYKEYVVVDGYSGYDVLAERGIKIQRCWVHIRRKFVDCFKILNVNDQIKHPAYNITLSINKLFKQESEFKENCLKPKEIKKARNSEEYQNILKEIDDKITLESQKEKISDNLSKAINYYTNIKEKGELYTFLEDGMIEIDNNTAERIVKPFVIGRKNYLFCKTKNGANISAVLYTIVQTALKNGIEPFDYITYLLENINKEEIENLLPWNKNISDKFSIFKKEKNQNPEEPEEK